MTNRRIAETNLNMQSSRSHSIIRIETVDNVINLVDLAGSENNKKTGNTGERMKESQNINTSLFVLSKVVNSIIKKESRVPYRDSKVTRILKESFSGESRCYIIATVIDEIDEDGLTVNTLGFASKSRQILAIEKPKDQSPTTLSQIKNLPFTVKRDKPRIIEVPSLSSSMNKSKIDIKIPVKPDTKIVSSIEDFEIETPTIKRKKVCSKASDSSSIIRGSVVNNQIEMTPITKHKSRECFINKAIEYEKLENFKLALDKYKTAYRISQSKDIEEKILELNRIRKSLHALLSEETALRALNSGSFIEIKKLNAIGDKRAKIISDFISGGNYFESLDDLKMLFNAPVVEKILKGIEK